MPESVSSVRDLTNTLFIISAITSVGVKLSRRLAEIATFGTLLFLIGCASSGPVPVGVQEPVTTSAQQLKKDMLLDLVSVLPQILEPLGTTIQFNETESGDVNPVVVRLVEMGYGLQRVDADQGRYFLQVADVTQPDDVGRQETRLRLSVGGIELTRSYKTVTEAAKINPKAALMWRDDNAIIPAGPFLVAGTRSRISVKGFELATTPSTDSNEIWPLALGSVQYTSVAPIAGGIPTISLITDELVQQVAQSSFPGPGFPLLLTESFKLENMTHVFDEAFASIADNYDRIGRETVIFPNDSRKLGRPGKLIVKKLITRFSENTDLVGIIGCSNGKTRLAIGNEGLALGRAQRIAEEFFTAGISREKVFNEGCWSPKAGTPGFPNRGVVIDLWRRKG